MNIITPLPHQCYLACSGGVDSMFALHFLRKGKRKVQPIFFNHGTETSRIAEEFLTVNMFAPIIGRLTRDKLKEESPEEYYRNQRYAFFSAFNDAPIITCHHLDDQFETAILGTLQGKQFRIPYRRGNFIRPFLNVSKKEILDYANRHGLCWVEDESNNDISIPRNRVRHMIFPQMKLLNPSVLKNYVTLN